MILFELPVRSIHTSSSAVFKIWIRCISTDSEFVRPPGPMSTWSKDEINAWRRRRYANDITYREKNIERSTNYGRRPDVIRARKELYVERYANDPAYRLRLLQSNAKWKAGNQEALSLYKKERYKNDPDYRAALKEDYARWRAKPENRKSEAKRENERYQNDLDFREQAEVWTCYFWMTQNSRQIRLFRQIGWTRRQVLTLTRHAVLLNYKAGWAPGAESTVFDDA
ncbi:hypothetical protein M436DRAFT_61557 [Aureobasidium namibiae CBS 147.97]|uniref:Uncharacterized protein n=1 Tax=Aureobasidium namibiae CBS 147.97 TaxID=1043004 RepID=A0A074X2S0_9PEZI|nr:uncharacterized protein M436DRAFT_61557 [Aureobasidium namibiae CBS 147.97]KEQ76302.1 hypothetical protein M436DRAFT_61557 [Aureobasidium namibiae CBS 147.97]